MATEHSVPVDPGALSQRVAALHNQVHGLEKALEATRTTRLIIVVGFVALVAVVGSLFYSLGKRVQDKQYHQELMAVAQARIEANKDEYTKEVQRLLDDATPVVTKAFADQAKKDTHLYVQALNDERARLQENLQQKLAEQVDAKYEATLKKYAAALVQEFPQAADARTQERMMTNLRMALDGLVNRYYVKMLQQELQQMYETWDTFPVAAAPGKDDPALEDQLVGSLLDLLVMQASGQSNLQVEIMNSEAAAAAPSASATAAPATPLPASTN